MTTAVASRLLSKAVYDILDAHPTLQVYDLEVSSAAPVDDNGVVKGYAVILPGGPNTMATSLDGQQGPVLWQCQVSCVGGNRDYVLGVADVVTQLLSGKTLAVAGAKVGLLQPPLGYQPPPAYRDPDMTPVRFRIPLQYQVLAVPA